MHVLQCNPQFLTTTMCSRFTLNIEIQITILFIIIFNLSLFSFTEVRPCQYEGVLKQPGESFHSNDCQKQCTCSLQGELLCQPTVCPSGLEIRGNHLYLDIRQFDVSEKRKMTLYFISNNYG